ncbi:MAG: YjbH domain-containing protein, partial [Deltaproteobacteria bacterium]|nr:YjbH domain-containing protein [Deltaproteobacteria bacterium]
SLIAEYSSDRYIREAAFGTFRPHTQWNFGANYRLPDSFQIGVAWLYGESIAMTLSVDIDPTKSVYPEHIAPKPVAPVIRDSKEQLQALEKLRNEQQKSVALAKGLPWVRLPPPPQDAVARFVDGVMTASSDVRDVEFQGARLLIATDRTGETPAACRAYARLAATYLRDVRTVALQGASRNDVTCQISPQDAAMASGLWRGAPLLSSAAMPVQTSVTFAEGDESSPGDGGNLTASDSSGIRAAEAAIRRDAAGQSIGIEALSLSATEATVYFRNTHYGSDAEAIGRLVRVLMKNAPAGVEIFHLISMDDGIPVQEYQVLRSPMERALTQRAGPTETRQAFSVHYPEMDAPILDRGRAGSYPRFKWSLFPELRESLFDPDKPVRFAVLAGLSGGIEIVPGLSLDTKLEANIFNDFKNGRPSNSVLPHVRSDFVQYYRHGTNGIESLQASYRFRFTPSIFGIVKGGYLESMFGGAGGEVLWRPENTRLALGVDLYEVWQRKFDRLFGFQSYRVLTGHVTIYYASPWYGLNFRVHAGRYLARDRGATFEITRRFSTGVEIGAFATFTNVPASKFGEGSFDKGIVIRIPLDWALPVSTQSQFNVDLRPLTRDGGQRLSEDTTLYDATRRTSYGNFLEDFDNAVSP